SGPAGWPRSLDQGRSASEGGSHPSLALRPWSDCPASSIAPPRRMRMRPRKMTASLWAALPVLALTGRAWADPDLRYVDPNPATGTSGAVVVGEAPLAHTAQLLPLDAKGNVAGKGKAAVQAEAVLENLAAALGEARSGLDRVVKVNVYAARPEVVA